MTTATTVLSNRTAEPRTGPSLEELVDRVIEALFGSDEPEVLPRQRMARSLHDARRMRKSGDLNGALALFASVDTATAEAKEARWAYAEWLDVARRRFGGDGALVYSTGVGRAAALAPRDDNGTLEVLAVLGMRWNPGAVVSRRSLRGLKPLRGGGS